MQVSPTTNIERSLSLKLVALTLGSTLLFTLMLTAMDIWNRYQTETDHISWVISEVVKSHNESLAQAVWSSEQAVVEKELANLLSIQDVDAVSLQTEDGDVVQFGQPLKDPPFQQSFSLMITPQGGAARPVATLTVQSALVKTHEKILDRVFITILQQFVTSAIVAALLFFAVNISYVRPLSQISSYLEDFKPERSLPDLKVDRMMPKGGYDELDSLVDHINSLKDRVLMSHWALKEMNFDLEKRVEERTLVILEQRQKLESSARWSALGEMAGSIAHEINNPLAIIMGKSQLILRKEITDDVRNSLNGIIKTTQRIADIIQSLRVLSRDASRDPFEFVPAAVILKDAMGLSSERLRKKEIEVSISENFDSYEISCRRVQIAQILVNLINNAVDALEGSEKRWIQINLAEKAGLLTLSIVDSGHGFSKDIQSKVMTPFFTTKEIGKGTGLGLSLSKAIMTAHGGQLEVDFGAAHTTINVKFKTFRAPDMPHKIAG
ncbi:MAG: GHKL domain-containing protein [Bdellovibrionaceae bacterium]|nr:GHKL domain-containing protein [Pseudobdellovibrionaceae bacterium]